ncbi:hypothetical protein SBV1_2300020 [Verrucomicrobia bacterium]|nr:hypothetical protein SBV1_2300020 [Verrucomicrobiota bacterium]
MPDQKTPRPGGEAAVTLYKPPVWEYVLAIQPNLWTAL